jgi:lipoyl synthase
MSTAQELFALPWDDLQRQSWAVRLASGDNQLTCAVPGLRRYATEDYTNVSCRFTSISVTGEACKLHCAHCEGQMLRSMRPARTAAELLSTAEELVASGCQGVLISGGCDASGAVPLAEHLPALPRLKAMGLRVLVHTGLLNRRTAEALKEAGVDQVLLDVVGDADTSRQVLHLDRSPDDYLATLTLLHELRIPTVPHVIVGLHYGVLRGELAALEMIRTIEPAAIVLVALRPLKGTEMVSAPTLPPAEFGQIAATARLLFPNVPLSLGCARPSSAVKLEYERLALLAGINTIAFPDPATVRLAGELGLHCSFVESCCSGS